MDSTSSLPSFERRNWCHDVFLSFCGEDVWRGFLSHLRKEFERKGITLLIDCDTERSKTIGHELVEAIKGSKRRSRTQEPPKLEKGDYRKRDCGILRENEWILRSIWEW